MATQPLHSTVILRLDGATKSFGGAQALKGVTFEVRAGEVVGLAGENGAGKSTIKNIIGGALAADEGQVLLDGQAVSGGVASHRRQGIETIHQEISLFPDLSVAENVLIASLSGPVKGVVARRANRERANTHLARLDSTISPDRLVGDLSTGESQLVEIAKSLTSEPTFIIFDEPTASLPLDERQDVLRLVRSLADEGVGIIYISHHLDELFSTCDRIVVLRDGQLIADKPTSEYTREHLEELMVGRELAKGYPALLPPRPEVVLDVDQLTNATSPTGISFSIRAGEIFGLSGLMGAGRTECARAIFGLDSRTGVVKVDGTVVGPSVGSAIDAGIAFVTENRRDEGLFLEKPIRENASVVFLSDFAKRGVISSSDERANADAVIADRGIAVRGGIEAHAGSLSGGNQQKLVMGKWLVRKPKLLILDEPTRGVDVGAKAEVYRALAELAAQGVAMLLISSEMEEVMGMSHRVGVMHEGRLEGILDADEVTPEALIRLATGGRVE